MLGKLVNKFKRQTLDEEEGGLGEVTMCPGGTDLEDGTTIAVVGKVGSMAALGRVASGACEKPNEADYALRPSPEAPSVHPLPPFGINMKMEGNCAIGTILPQSFSSEGAMPTPFHHHDLRCHSHKQQKQQQLEQQFCDSGTESEDDDELVETLRAKESMGTSYLEYGNGATDDGDCPAEFCGFYADPDDSDEDGLLRAACSPPTMTSEPPLISEIDTHSWDSSGCESGIVIRDSAERDDDGWSRDLDFSSDVSCGGSVGGFDAATLGSLDPDSLLSAPPNFTVSDLPVDFSALHNGGGQSPTIHSSSSYATLYGGIGSQPVACPHSNMGGPIRHPFSAENSGHQIDEDRPRVNATETNNPEEVTPVGSFVAAAEDAVVSSSASAKRDQPHRLHRKLSQSSLSMDAFMPCRAPMSVITEPPPPPGIRGGGGAFRRVVVTRQGGGGCTSTVQEGGPPSDEQCRRQISLAKASTTDLSEPIRAVPNTAGCPRASGGVVVVVAAPSPSTAVSTIGSSGGVPPSPAPSIAASSPVVVSCCGVIGEKRRWEGEEDDCSSSGAAVNNNGATGGADGSSNVHRGPAGDGTTGAYNQQQINSAAGPLGPGNNVAAGTTSGTSPGCPRSSQRSQQAAVGQQQQQQHLHQNAHLHSYSNEFGASAAAVFAAMQQHQQQKFAGGKPDSSTANTKEAALSSGSSSSPLLCSPGFSAPVAARTRAGLMLMMHHQQQLMQQPQHQFHPVGQLQTSAQTEPVAQQFQQQRQQTFSRPMLTAARRTRVRVLINNNNNNGPVGVGIGGTITNKGNGNNGSSGGRAGSGGSGSSSIGSGAISPVGAKAPEGGGGGYHLRNHNQQQQQESDCRPTTTTTTTTTTTALMHKRGRPAAGALVSTPNPHHQHQQPRHLHHQHSGFSDVLESPQRPYLNFDKMRKRLMDPSSTVLSPAFGGGILLSTGACAAVKHNRPTKRSSTKKHSTTKNSNNNSSSSSSNKSSSSSPVTASASGSHSPSNGSSSSASSPSLPLGGGGGAKGRENKNKSPGGRAAGNNGTEMEDRASVRMRLRSASAWRRAVPFGPSEQQH